MTARTAPPGRIIIARAVLLPTDDGGYGGDISVWACKYKVEAHRVATGVLLVLYQDAGGVQPAAGYRQPAVDGEG